MYSPELKRLSGPMVTATELRHRGDADLAKLKEEAREQAKKPEERDAVLTYPPHRNAPEQKPGHMGLTPSASRTAKHFEHVHPTLLHTSKPGGVSFRRWPTLTITVGDGNWIWTA